MFNKLKSAFVKRSVTPICVHAVWDDQACVWIATSKDVPGLVTEAASEDELIAKLKVMVPELLALNSGSVGNEDLPCAPLDLSMRGHRSVPLGC